MPLFYMIRGAPSIAAKHATVIRLSKLSRTKNIRRGTMATTTNPNVRNNGQVGDSAAFDADYDPYIDASGPAPQADTPRPRFNLLSAAQALQPQPPIQWIVENLLAEASLNIFFGEPGCKKTWALIDMAVCVA